MTQHRSDFAALTRDEKLIVAALDQAQASHTSPRQLIRIVNTLHDYLELGGHWNTGMRLRSWQLAACRAMGDRAGEGATLNNLGELARSLGQREQARAYYEQALAIFQAIGDVVHVRGVTENMAALDAGNSDTPSGEAPDATPEKPLPPKRRRWPWPRKPTP